MRRIASIWFPALAIERWRKGSDFAPDSPVVLTVEGAHGPVIHAVTRAAAKRGARAGARLTDARALDPGLIAVPADPEGDRALLDRLARWAQRWSPLVEVDGVDSLRMDITGIPHLFGGEEALAEDGRERFRTLGLTARITIAPTAGAAWALARYSSPRRGEDDSAKLSGERGIGDTPLVRTPSPYPLLSEERDLEEALAPLPVAALRLDCETVRTLERLGLKTIGAVASLPRLVLARRFRGAEDVVDSLDRMLGRKEEPLTALVQDPPPRASLRFAEPATNAEAAIQALGRLVPELVDKLEQRRLGARRLSLRGFRVDGSVAQASVATAIPSRDGEHLERLLAGKATALDPGYGVDCFTLAADWTEHLEGEQKSLVDEPDPSGDIARLIDRLSVKLGSAAVRRPQLFASHAPERASGWRTAIAPLLQGRGSRGGGPMKSSAGGQPPPSNPSPSGEGRIRPQRLLDRPEAIDVIYATPEGMPRRFVWRRLVHDIARSQGPERIAPEWWRERSTARLRDYYRVEDSAGRRYWIFREGVIGDGRGGAPLWFIHGLFG